MLIALATVLTPVCVLASWHDVDEPAAAASRAYFALLLLLETFMIGVFAATDVFLFYVFFEAMLIPMYFIIGSYGGPQRSYAAVKFLLYSLVGGLLMLAAVIGLYVVSDGGRAGVPVRAPPGDSTWAPTTERLLFLGFFVAFAIKAPLWPVHTWLPDAAAESPPGGAVLLVGVLDKVGTFGMIRLLPAAVPRRLAVGDAGRDHPGGRSASSTAHCWRSGRPTSSASSPTRRSRTSASSRWASSR